MCGRYTLWELDMLGDRFAIGQQEFDGIKTELHATYNIAPTQTEPTIIQKGKKRHIALMRWGYVAPWMKDIKDTFKYTSFNARSEDIFIKPMWKRAIREARCLVPANGFYEWVHTKSGKQPYFIRPKDQELFGFAGVYGTWNDAEGREWPTYAILTTQSIGPMLDVHYRMPVIVHPKDEARWLDKSNDTLESIAGIMRPYEDGELEIVKVSKDVNSSRIDNPQLITPLL